MGTGYWVLSTNIVHLPDCDLAGLLDGLLWGSVTDGIATQDIDFASLGFLGKLLSGSLALLTDLCVVIVLSVGAQ